MTVEYREYIASGGTYSWSDWADYIFWDPDHYVNCGGFKTRDVIDHYEKVQVGTEKVQTGTKKVQTGTEKVQVGTEKVKVGTKQVYDHKECTECGATG